uniref:STE/STE20/FRAY protein kinase n=1 Tax=Kwoniella dejecticola CBS 10117 TaxID=1296121 RepID=A0A1A5ZVQ2_9TREE|nr:STE/STE20/FRAY protein kinase [Kwoniella dejecticola CBS 10117]OBR81880.1 STE/STE20/FRAY protein kinase [Kwoniella dejecticola CBS 10117]
MSNQQYHQSNARPAPNPGMMDDEYWGVFTSNSDQYEIGSPIGFGASSTVYEAIFTPHQPELLHLTDTISTVTPAGSDTKDDINGKSSFTAKPKPKLSIKVTHGIQSQDSPPLKERICAIKVSTSHPDVELLNREIKLLGLCKHPNVLRILSTFTLPPDHHRICLVTPLIPGGSLAGIMNWRSRLSTSPRNHRLGFRLGRTKRREGEDVDEEVDQNGRLNEEEVKSVTKQVLDGLGYLHQNGFLHRDIKAGNLLIDGDGTILLADFGVGGDLNTPPSPVRTRKTQLGVEDLKFDGETPSTAKIRQNGSGLGPGKADEKGFVGGEDLKKRKSFVGTPNWMAPEVILGRKYDQKADIWSLGITLLELAHGSVPGSKYQTSKALSHIITEPAPSLDRSIGSFTKLMKEFIDLCLNKDPTMRPTAKTLMDHHWLKNAKKPSFLAQSLLADVPPLTQRQELRRVPTMSSMLSHTSSWDFASNTPNPSLPSSPMKSTLNIHPARSPSISSHLEYFSSVGRSHSRNSSFSLQPPSPRVSLKQWADDTYNHNHGAIHTHGSSLSLSLRAGGSERGRKRNSLISHDSIRRGKSVNFDSTNIKNSKNAFIPSTSLEAIPHSVNPAPDSSNPKNQSALGMMSPVMEITRSKDSNVDHLDLNLPMRRLGISDANARTPDVNICGLSESPDDVIDVRRSSEMTPLRMNEKRPVDAGVVADGGKNRLADERAGENIPDTNSLQGALEVKIVKDTSLSTKQQPAPPSPPSDQQGGQENMTVTAEGGTIVRHNAQAEVATQDKDKNRETRSSGGSEQGRDALSRKISKPQSSEALSAVNEKMKELESDLRSNPSKSRPWHSVLAKVTNKMHKR